MSQRAAFKRQPVPAPAAQHLQSTTIPAPIRGLIESENLAYMQPAAAVILDNWKPTMRGIALRGGCKKWCDVYDNGVDPPPAMDDPTRLPLISGFEYASGNSQRMFAANRDTLFDVTFAGPPIVVKTGQSSGNYSASHLSNYNGDYMLAVNDGGDYPMRFDGATWTTLDSGEIHFDGGGSTVTDGHNLTYVWKYRNRWFFIEGGSMNAYYLGIDAVQGQLNLIPLSGAATKGGKLLFGATWTISAGDGLDDKCVFYTDQGEALVFTGTNPSDAANWRQEGRFDVGVPMGMNAHTLVAGDLLIATIDGLVPMSSAMSKDGEQLQLSMLTKNIKSTWRHEATTKNVYPWTMKRWDEYGGMFVTWPGGKPGAQICAVVNNATGAWCRYVGWDAMFFIKLRGDMFYGTQKGLIQQADRTGYDDGLPYVATFVGGWEMFQSPAQSVTWRQARAAFSAKSNEPFNPQISATTDYVITIPTPPPPGPDVPGEDVWDEGLWDDALWDQESTVVHTVRNTGWVSVGLTGFSHAPIVQITVAQTNKPDVELVSIAALYERLGINV